MITTMTTATEAADMVHPTVDTAPLTMADMVPLTMADMVHPMADTALPTTVMVLPTVDTVPPTMVMVPPTVDTVHPTGPDIAALPRTRRTRI